MRKIINDPESFVDEMLAGLLAAHGDQLRAASPDNRALVRADAPTGKVGIVTGGGSGHLPTFLGLVGKGLCSGVAVGNVFSSPAPQQWLAAITESDGGKGVLLLYGNYGGDIFNADLAAEMAELEDIETTTVLVADDVASQPKDKKAERRGVGGLFFAYKCAGAAAERGDDLATVARIAQEAVDNTGSMGIGLSPTILPAAGKPTFTLDEGEMEIGIGIHGEPGIHRGPLESADQITDRLYEPIREDLELQSGDRVAVLVNGMGATPLEELYIMYRRLAARLEADGVGITFRYIGEYATSLEMAGASITLMKLSDELAELVAAPASSPFFQQV